MSVCNRGMLRFRHVDLSLGRVCGAFSRSSRSKIGGCRSSSFSQAPLDTSSTACIKLPFHATTTHAAQPNRSSAAEPGQSLDTDAGTMTAKLPCLRPRCAFCTLGSAEASGHPFIMGFHYDPEWRPAPDHPVPSFKQASA